MQLQTQFPQSLIEGLRLITSYLNLHPLAHYGLIAFTFLLLLILIRMMKHNEKIATRDALLVDLPPDIQTIAGDDVISTQLDLAKAYIEINQKSKAKKMLKDVIKQGNDQQQQQANRLLQSL